MAGNGFQQLPHDFFEGPAARLGVSGAILYLALRRHADSKGFCYPSVTKLQQETGMSRSTVIRNMTELEQIGAIKADRNKGARNHYQVVESVNWCQNDTSVKMKPVSKRDSHQCQNGTGTSVKMTPEEESVKKTQITRPILSQDFDVFWTAYSRKEDKKKAVEMWKRMATDEQTVNDIMAGLDRAKQSDAWRNGFVPYAFRWLRDERWKDETFKADAAAKVLAAPDEDAYERQARIRYEESQRMIARLKRTEADVPMPQEIRGKSW